ncbi:MAG TPA: DNA gyrase C-terminal beta-propeller domain-containing protein, partial [Clostridia bacterium]|nr:DNA gyrase C-terminal beta-propeller domain-containing protein [Clostridia bacterium]
VRGISLDEGDLVVALAVVVKETTLLVVGENGIGKRTPFDMTLEDGTVEQIYRLQSRGGKGIITMKTNERTGGLVGALPVRDTDEIMVMTNKGQMVRTFVKDIRETGRNAQGVKVIDVEEGDKLQAIAPVISEQQEVDATEGGSSPEGTSTPEGASE